MILWHCVDVVVYYPATYRTFKSKLEQINKIHSEKSSYISANETFWPQYQKVSYIFSKKAFLIFRKMEILVFQEIELFSLIFFIFWEMELFGLSPQNFSIKKPTLKKFISPPPPKKIFIFRETELSYILGNGTF